jgi:hypothetical protein
VSSFAYRAHTFRLNYPSPPSCISRIWDTEGELEYINAESSSGQVILGRIYLKLGGGEEKKTPRKLTARNKIPAPLPLQMKRWVCLAHESHDASREQYGSWSRDKCLEHLCSIGTTTFDVACTYRLQHRKDQ